MFFCATDLNLDPLHLSSDDLNHQDHSKTDGETTEAGDNEEEDGETPETENSRLLGDSDDSKTAQQLQTFMESVTAKILEQQHHRGASPAEHSTSGRGEERGVRVVGGVAEPLCQSDLVTSQSHKQPLLQEMSEPTQDREADDQSVEC